MLMNVMFIHHCGETCTFSPTAIPFMEVGSTPLHQRFTLGGQTRDVVGTAAAAHIAEAFGVLGKTHRIAVYFGVWQGGQLVACYLGMDQTAGDGHDFAGVE